MHHRTKTQAEIDQACAVERQREHRWDSTDWVIAAICAVLYLFCQFIGALK